MKLLKITASGLPLLKEKLTVTFYARQRVNEIDRDILCPLGQDSKFYLNPATAFIGINASGKTTILKVILLVLDILNNQSINHSETKDVLGDAEDAVFVVHYLTDQGKLCQLETHITAENAILGKYYRITNEALWKKQFTGAMTKSQLTDFTGISPCSVRSGDEEYLQDDMSIIISENKKSDQKTMVSSLLSMTDKNILPVSDDVPVDVIRFLDPTIEKLKFTRNGEKVSISLKFYGKKEMKLSDPEELNLYLSSGTIKGFVTFTMAIQALRTGGYLIVDELENHFNKEIAATLIRFFMDSSLNRNGGSLLFSTHYPEILDEFDRNDAIYIIRNRKGITAENLADILKRNDIKKSDAYQSGFLEGTVPAYDAYLDLKDSIEDSLRKEN